MMCASGMLRFFLSKVSYVSRFVFVGDPCVATNIKFDKRGGGEEVRFSWWLLLSFIVWCCRWRCTGRRSPVCTRVERSTAEALKSALTTSASAGGQLFLLLKTCAWYFFGGGLTTLPLEMSGYHQPRGLL